MLAHRIRYHCNYAMGKYKYKYKYVCVRVCMGGRERLMEKRVKFVYINCFFPSIQI